MLFRYLLEPGDRVIVEQPSYDRTLLLLEPLGVELVGVPLEADGIDVDGARGGARRRARSKLAHVIPNFHNPAGCTLSAAKRERLVELAAEHGFWIFEDDPYRLSRASAASRCRRCSSLDGAEPRDPRLLVLEDGQPRRPGRLPGRARRRDRDARQARQRDLHLAEHARRVDRARALPLGRARPRTSSSSTARCASAATRSSRRSREQIPEAEFVVPERRLLPLARPRRGRRHRRRCSPPPRRRASPSSPAPTSCSRAASSSLRLSFASVPAEQIPEGVGRLAGALERLRAATRPSLDRESAQQAASRVEQALTRILHH